MSGLKEIRRRIQSVVNTKQITRAMKLVSAAKLRRAQDAATNGRVYRDRLQGVLETVAVDLNRSFDSVLLTKREVKKRRVIIIAGERGLCGAYNTNVIKSVIANDLANKEVVLEFVPVGRRAVAASNRYALNVIEAYESLPEDANFWPIDKIISKSIEDFKTGACDEVVVYYTTFVSAMTQQVTREVLLPLTSLDSASLDSKSSAQARNLPGQIKYDAEPEAIVANILPLLTRTRLLQAALESKASEHAARMTAMDSATNNADDLIHSLRLYYNRARQSTITRELLDILGGAEALQG